MTDEDLGAAPPTSGQDQRDLPVAPQVRERSGFSIIWLIPLVAALIGGWVAYRAWAEQGPTVRVSFKNAEGVEAGKTKVRFRNVVVGEVIDVGVSDDLTHVVVTARLAKHSDDYLTDKTRFWVETARIAGGRVSGLNTLLSGAYIGVDPSDRGTPARSFIGLEQPPLVTQGEEGRHFVLRGETLGSLQVGSPVYFRGFKVGEVVERALESGGDMAQVRVFVSVPYDARVTVKTKFWNDSGLDVSVTADGLQVDTESVASILIGGIGFDQFDEVDPGRRAEDGHVFDLHPNKRATREQRFRSLKPYRVYFSEPVGGLTPGSRVDFRGMHLGEVREVRLEFDMDGMEFRIPVLLELEEGRIAIVGKSKLPKQAMIAAMVEKGLRAQLKTANLLSGAKRIELDMFPGAAPAELVIEDGIPVLPVVPAPLTGILSSVTEVLNKLDGLPLEAIAEELRGTLAGTNRVANSEEIPRVLRAARASLEQVETLSRSLNQEVQPLLQQAKQALGSADDALRQAKTTLRTVSDAVDQESPLYQDLAGMLRELNQAARSIRVLADYLERHPEALVSGKSGR